MSPRPCDPTSAWEWVAIGATPRGSPDCSSFGTTGLLQERPTFSSRLNPLGAPGETRERAWGALCVAILIAWSGTSAVADSIVNSRHNLSASGPGPVRASTETEVCIFCHTPHGASGEAPLWNRTSSGANYTTYLSSTTKAAIGQPTGSSRLCLSCHDGTIALGMVQSRTEPIPMSGGITTMPNGHPAHLGTDLSDDHPISFVYSSSLAAANGQLRDPSALSGRVRLENGQLQCTTCHDPHDDANGSFLVMPNTASALCLECHAPNQWAGSSHATSSRTWNGSTPDPWPHTALTTVSDNACENCHRPHSAGTPERLLNFATEEDNCTACHNGNVASKNVEAVFNKSSVHPIHLTTHVHDPTEDPVNAARHVECVDCHNPHASNGRPASAPNASGALDGVTGITVDGTVTRPLQKEFELCFRCHGDSLSRGPSLINRQFPETNTRVEFSPTSASFHPVAAVGKNPDVPSLLAPWTTSSMMYCTDCHNNDQGPNAGGTGPAGPHGSAFAPILERNLVLTDNQAESATAYALCYKCHSRTSILADRSFPHKKHVQEERSACTTCHDPHGVAGQTQLINFNLNYVTPRNGRIEFVKTGRFNGNCTLVCHGESHNAESY
ncbi:MAG: hypothetical protein JNK85_05780 [Verrucomicrobiales bacterium]|nr:hypothetical protein [Verrucomicrobiales bacterium]